MDINPAKSRWLELDWLRGLAVMGMILVVSPGSWSHRISQLDHAVWNGFTAADLVMPLFLFSVGLSIGLGNPTTAPWKRAISRTFWLVVLGLGINLMPNFNLVELRIPGVLQRIAQTYFLAFAIWKLSRANPRIVFASIMSLLVLNIISIHFTEIPGIETTELTPYANLASYLDRAIFGVHHLWPYGTYMQMGVVYDPEGLLAGIFATTNVLCGCLAVTYLKPSSSPLQMQKLVVALIMVAIGLTLSLIISFEIPINKTIWSVSFFFLTTSLSLGLVCSLALLRSIVPHRLMYWFFIVPRVFGCNAILAYIISSILLAYSGTSWITGMGIQTLVFNKVSVYVADPWLSSFICSIIVLSFIFCLLSFLHKRRLYLRL